MEWDLVLKFIRPELFVLIIFLWCIGLFLKKAPWFKSEWSIPYILLFVSIIFTIIYMAIVVGEGFSPQVIITAIIQAVLIASVAVFGNELIKQGLKKRDEDKLK